MASSDNGVVVPLNETGADFGERDVRINSVEYMARSMVDAEIDRLNNKIAMLKKLKGLILDHELHLRMTVVRDEKDVAGKAEVQMLALDVKPEYYSLVESFFPIE